MCIRDSIYRLPGLGKVKRNDVLVFNFPYLEQRWDSIAFRVMKYYVKRCVALPGDTFEISRGHYKVHGYTSELGNVESQDNLMRIVERGREVDYGIVMRGYPYSDIVDCDRDDFQTCCFVSECNRMGTEKETFVTWRYGFVER